jgi:hypothetical protein
MAEAFKLELLTPEGESQAELLEPENSTGLTALFNADGLINEKDLKKEEPTKEDSEEKKPIEGLNKESESKTTKIVGDAENFVIDIVDYFDEEELPELKEAISKLETAEDKIAYLKEKLDEKITGFAEQTVQETTSKVLTPLQNKFKQLVETGVSEKESADIVLTYKNLSEITKDQVEENPAIAKKIYTNHLKLSTTFSDEKIKKMVDGAETLGTLTETAMESFDELKDVLKQKETKAVEVAKKQKEEQELAVQNSAKEFNDYLENLTDLGGIKLTNKMKTNLIKSFTPSNGVDPIQELSSYNKREFNTLVRFIASNLVTYNKKTNTYQLDFTPVQAVVEKKAVDAVRKDIAQERAVELMKSTTSGLNENKDTKDNKDDLWAVFSKAEEKIKNKNNY